MFMQRSVSASKAKSLFSKRSSSMSILPKLPTSFVMNVRHFGSSEEPLVKTAFYDMHLSMGGKMVPFAGYELPVQYSGAGVLKEHNHTRTLGKSSLFDVSHMGQLRWRGKDAVRFIEKMVCGDIACLDESEGKLSLIMNENGGIVDDTVITNAGDYIYMVVNGACKHKDMAHFNKYMADFDGEVFMEYMEDQQLLALQGPGAVNALSNLIDSNKLDLMKMNFMTGIDIEVGGIPECRVTRCGYTGEDGFEISVSYNKATDLAEMLLKQDGVAPCGLGARDSLRLEAGLCLYGNDLNDDITPVEGTLVWTIGGPKTRRRTEQGFLGADKILEESGKLKPITKKRVGFSGMKAPARQHTKIFNADGSKQIGEITSGGFGPTANKAIAMGFVDTDMAKEGTPVLLEVRNKMVEANVTKMPFVDTSYYKAP